MATSLSRILFRGIICQQSIKRLAIKPTAVIPSRTISTTDKKKDGAISVNVHHDAVSTKPGGEVNTDYENRKDWISRGCDLEDEDYDRWKYYTHCFFLITVMLVFVPWIVKYTPNKTWPNKDWLQREAFLELHRREKYGLPLIDPDFVNRDNVVLPDEEDLEDFDIVI